MNRFSVLIFLILLFSSLNVSADTSNIYYLDNENQTTVLDLYGDDHFSFVAGIDYNLTITVQEDSIFSVRLEMYVLEHTVAYPYEYAEDFVEVNHSRWDGEAYESTVSPGNTTYVLISGECWSDAIGITELTLDIIASVTNDSVVETNSTGVIITSTEIGGTNTYCADFPPVYLVIVPMLIIPLRRLIKRN